MGTINKIKLYGFGVVGQGFQTYLAKNEDAKRLHTIIVKNDSKKRKNVDSIIELTNSKTIKDKDVDVILELISSSEEAYGIVAENLEIGKKVISANKKLIAENLKELIKIEKDNDATFLYEGAVCGSIPIIRVLNDLFVNEQLSEVKGIFNGSSNYILTKLFNEEISYAEALEEAQNLGYAEADPTSDVGGFDALYKLIIIAAHAFGIILKPEQVLNFGIEGISKEDIDFAKQYNLKIKLLAKAAVVGGKINLSVLPTLVSDKNELYNVENEYNGVVVEGKDIGTHFYKGKGAGSFPTGAVVYSDLKAIDANYRYSYQKLGGKSLYFDNNENVTLVLSGEDSVSLKNLESAFSSFYPLDLYGRRFIATISIKKLQNIKYDLRLKNISVLGVEDNELIEILTQTSNKNEAIAV
ncbi:MAG: homoserine dehydrogenase [Flavobacteriales bacterium]|nr:MAG: homoserine dehydrogenase [Flavobacteriales bacterium]